MTTIFSLYPFSIGILVTAVTLNTGFGAVIFTYSIMVGWGIGASYGLLLSLAASVSHCLNQWDWGIFGSLVRRLETLHLSPYSGSQNTVAWLSESVPVDLELEPSSWPPYRPTSSTLTIWPSTTFLSRFSLAALCKQALVTEIMNLFFSLSIRMFENEEMLRRVPKCLYILGGILAGLQVIGVIFVRPRPEKKAPPIDSEDSK